jgi:hypothetical protein
MHLTRLRFYLTTSLCLLGVVAAGCGNDGPTTPTGPVPEITTVDPSQLSVDPSPQVLSVAGQGFTPGLTVLVTRPNGTRVDISGDAVQGLQSVSFQVSVPFDAAGEYGIAVRLLSGVESNEIRVSAGSNAVTAPRIDVVTPGTVQTGPTATVVTLTGVNFTSGSSVSLTTPNGTTSVLPASAVVGVQPTAIQLSIVFSAPGTYAVSVTNAQGQVSNTATITAF